MFYGFHCSFSYGLGGWLNKSSLPLDGPLILGPPLEPRSRADNPKNTSFSEKGGRYGVGESRIFINTSQFLILSPQEGNILRYFTDLLVNIKQSYKYNIFIVYL